MDLIALWSARENVKPAALSSTLFMDALRSYHEEVSALEISMNAGPAGLSPLPPASNTIRNRRDMVASACWEDTVEAQSSVDVISVSADGWSVHDNSYLGVSATVVAPEGHSSRILIGFEAYVSGEVRGEDSTAALLDAVAERSIMAPCRYSLPRVLVADSCCTNIAAFAASDFFSNGVLLPCSNHMLHNCVNAAVDFVPGLSSLIDRVRKASALIRGIDRFSVEVLRVYNAEPGKMSLKKAALLDGATRWNSTYNMIARFVEMRRCLLFVLENPLDPQHIFHTVNGRVRSVDNPNSIPGRMNSLLLFLRDVALMKELLAVSVQLEIVSKIAGDMQAEESHLGLVWRSIDFLKYSLTNALSPMRSGITLNSIPTRISARRICLGRTA